MARGTSLTAGSGVAGGSRLAALFQSVLGPGLFQTGAGSWDSRPLVQFGAVCSLQEAVPGIILGLVGFLGGPGLGCGEPGIGRARTGKRLAKKRGAWGAVRGELGGTEARRRGPSRDLAAGPFPPPAPRSSCCVWPRVRAARLRASLQPRFSWEGAGAGGGQSELGTASRSGGRGEERSGGCVNGAAGPERRRRASSGLRLRLVWGAGLRAGGPGGSGVLGGRTERPEPTTGLGVCSSVSGSPGRWRTRRLGQGWRAGV